MCTSIVQTRGRLHGMLKGLATNQFFVPKPATIA
jgi:hypothetical protein